MIEETIIQAALLSIEMFNGTQSKLEARMESIVNAAPTSGQSTIHIAFSKLTGSHILIAIRLKAMSLKLMWVELKRKLSKQYSGILPESHETPAFTHLEQGLDELLDDHLHFISKLQSEIYHTSDMSSILVEGTNHYAVFNGLNCRKLEDSISEHQSVQWRMMEECLRDIPNINAGYEKTNHYYRAKFNTPDTSRTVEIKTMQKTGLCLLC